MAETFTVAQLDKLIDLAVELRFWDDVKHWREMRARLLAESREGAEQ